MENQNLVIAAVKDMDVDALLELIVLAKTGGNYEKPLKARTVFRARKHLEALIENINQVMNHKDLGL